MTNSDKLVLGQIERVLEIASKLNVADGQKHVNTASAKLEMIVKTLDPSSHVLHPVQICKQSFIDTYTVPVKTPTNALREIVDILELSACMVDELTCYVPDMYYAVSKYQTALEILEF